MLNFKSSLTAAALLCLLACDNNNDPAPPAATEKEDGYVLHTLVDGNNAVSYVQHFDALPSGTVDNTNGTSYPFFRGRMQAENYLLSGNVNGAQQALSKIMFDLQGEPFEKALLPTIGDANFGAIKDRNTAYVDDLNDSDITIFDPETMQAKGKIDMSASFRDASWTQTFYEGFVVRGDEMFVCTRPRDNTGALYAGDRLIYSLIDLKTNTFVKNLFFPGALQVRKETESFADEQGNIYIPTQGNYTIPNVKPAILKIPAGSTDFDPNYNFKLVDQVNPQLPVQVLGYFTYHKNGKAYANISTTFPPDLLALFQRKPDFSQWNQDDFNLAFQILFTAANGQYAEVDLNARTVTVIKDIPAVSPFQAFANVIDDKVYFGVSNATENALYEYDPATKASRKVFDVSGGGTIQGFWKLKK